MAARVTVVDHPVIQHKLTLMRRQDTTTHAFRSLLEEISMLLAFEVTRDLPTRTERIETPLMTMEAPVLEGKKPVLVAILRAGIGIVEGLSKILPSARIGHVGLYRDHETLEAIEYFVKLPQNLEDREVIVADPMLATGHSAVAALARLKAHGARRLRFVCLLAAPEGIRHLQEQHADVPIFTAAVDQCLNEKGYILPGLGDAGDRLFGTR